MPPYPEKLINEGETVALDLKPHWWFFWKHIAFGAALLIAFGLWLGFGTDEKALKYPLAIAIVVYAAFVVVKYLTWTYTHFVLTDRRVISRSGIISKRGTEVPLDRVNNIEFTQKFWERIIGAGDLSIESAGRDGQSHFENVRHPDMVQQEIYRQMEVNSRRQASWHADATVEKNAGLAAPSPTAAPTAPDVTDQIAKLATLRDSGAITTEEFEEKKTELLDRMQPNVVKGIRVVSLVPSATESLLAMGVRPIACTRFCEQPTLPTVGGTKDPDLAAITALEPDVVVVNDEENRREDADALRAVGCAVHSMSPRSVGEVAPALDALARVLGVPMLEFALESPHAVRGSGVALIWRRPWMTQRSDTYGSSVLEHLGWTNPFATGADRYPRVELDAVAAIGPDLLVLPSEPYPFGLRHVPEIAAAVAHVRVELVDGRDLFWWGVRTPGALDRLSAQLK